MNSIQADHMFKITATPGTDISEAATAAIMLARAANTVVQLRFNFENVQVYRTDGTDDVVNRYMNAMRQSD